MMKRSTGLGRGFETLMPADFDQALLLDSKDRIQKLLIEHVHPNTDQPRRHFDEQALRELASSIKRYGVLQPLIVSPNGSEGEYRIVAGERRWRAARLAGLKSVPAIVRNQQELEELEIALIENVQRVDLSPLEQAVSIERLHQQFGIEYKEIAQRLGRAETTVSNIVRLLGLPEDARQALTQGLISEGHARAILSLRSNADQQQVLLSLIIKNGWSVRQAEQYVSDIRKQSSENAGNVVTAKTIDPVLQNKIDRLQHRFKVLVTIKQTKRGGKVELHYKNDKELESIFEQMQKPIE